MARHLLEYYRLSNFHLSKMIELQALFLPSHGFLNLYNDEVAAGKNAQEVFNELNELFKVLFGCYRYDSYMDFVRKTQQGSEVNKLERVFLMEWFKSCGFATWESFSPLVLHYYPEVTSKGLRDFYDGKLYTPDVLKKVDFVRQIIGK